MTRHPIVGLSLAATLLASCAQKGEVENRAAPPAAKTQYEASADLVVTGTRISGRVAAESSLYAPPPPPPAMVAPGIYMPLMASPPYHDQGRDKFASFEQNIFKVVREAPVSTFSIDVDTASYGFVRASLNRNVMPQPAAVRTEELVNYFPYDYAAPRSATQPFSTNVTVFPSPWTAGRKLVRIGIKGYAVQQAARPRANLVFLVDTSGSMQEPNKLPLVKQSLSLLLNELAPDDTVAIVTYAGNAGTALEPTRVRDKHRIQSVIDSLGAGGSTAGAEGIRQAYNLAAANLDPKGVNRVILATDGDFNVGITDRNELKGYIEREREKGVFLSVLGYGMGNYNDALMQALAQNGNGDRRLYRYVAGSAEDVGRGSQLDPVPDRQGREDPGRVQSGNGRRVPADRLRNARAQPRRLRQ